MEKNGPGDSFAVFTAAFYSFHKAPDSCFRSRLYLIPQFYPSTFNFAKLNLIYKGNK
jgi:hypothetical protein